MARKNRVGCVSHCAGCTRHFTGLTAFDAHRAGGICNPPAELRKKNGEPVLDGVEGFCNKMSGCFVDGKHVKDVEPVTVWQSYMNEAQRLSIREAFSKP